MMTPSNMNTGKPSTDQSRDDASGAAWITHPSDERVPGMFSTVIDLITEFRRRGVSQLRLTLDEERG